MTHICISSQKQVDNNKKKQCPQEIINMSFIFLNPIHT